MADVAILASQVQATPNGYTIPGGQEIILKSIRVQYNGAGAGGSFVPVLQLVAPGPTGQVVSEYPLGSTLAAGASADVTWFPGWTPAPLSSTGTAFPPVAIVSDANIAFPSNSYPLGAGVFTWGDMAAGNLFTSDATLYSLQTYHDGNPNASNPDFSGLRIHSKGTYLFDWGIQIYDTTGGVAAPGTKPINVGQDAAHNTSTSGLLTGGNIVYGFVGQAAKGEWDVTFSQVWSVSADTGTGAPVACQMAQASGTALTAYTSLLVTQLSTDTLGI